MNGSKYTEEQIVFALKQARTGVPVAEVCRKLGISKVTFYDWKKKSNGPGTAELRHLLQRLEVGSLLTARVINAGPSADVYDVSTSRGRFIVRHLRKYNRVEERLAARVHGRAQILHHLREASDLFPFAVPSYVSDSEGSCIVCIGDKCFETYSYIDGATQLRPKLIQTVERGRALALMHEALKHTPVDPGIPLPITPSEVRRRLTRIPQSMLHQTDAAFRLAVETSYPLYSRLSAHVPDNDDAFDVGPHMILHGDLHTGNVLYLSDHLHGIVDFDNIMFGPRLLDVARTIYSGRPWHALISGYNSIARLDSSEIKLLPVARAMFAVAAFANLALSPSPSNQFSIDLLTHRNERDVLILRQLEAGNL